MPQHGFKKCIGAIDGTFIKINAPTQSSTDPGAHNSYKKFYAIQTLAVALPNLTFTYVHTGTPGSHTDAYVLGRSTLMQEAEMEFKDVDKPNEGWWLLGDGGFPLLWWLIVPWSHEGSAASTKARRKKFNYIQSSSRTPVEIAFGVLKGRWRILRKGLECNFRHVTNTVDACITLHNVCIFADDKWPNPHLQENVRTRRLWQHRCKLVLFVYALFYACFICIFVVLPLFYLYIHYPHYLFFTLFVGRRRLVLRARYYWTRMDDCAPRLRQHCPQWST